MDYDDNGYFERLAERVDSAVKVPFRKVSLDGWEPRLNECHANVDRWVAHHPETTAMRGWLFWPPNEMRRWTFMAHSVVEDDGQLIDITPMDPNTPREGLLFLRHRGTEAEFEPMKKKLSQVVYPPISLEEWDACQLASSAEADIVEDSCPDLDTP